MQFKETTFCKESQIEYKKNGSQNLQQIVK